MFLAVACGVRGYEPCRMLLTVAHGFRGYEPCRAKFALTLNPEP